MRASPLLNQMARRGDKSTGKKKSIKIKFSRWNQDEDWSNNQCGLGGTVDEGIERGRANQCLGRGWRRTSLSRDQDGPGKDQVRVEVAIANTFPLSAALSAAISTDKLWDRRGDVNTANRISTLGPNPQLQALGTLHLQLAPIGFPKLNRTSALHLQVPRTRLAPSPIALQVLRYLDLRTRHPNLKLSLL